MQNASPAANLSPNMDMGMDANIAWDEACADHARDRAKRLLDSPHFSQSEPFAGRVAATVERALSVALRTKLPDRPRLADWSTVCSYDVKPCGPSHTCVQGRWTSLAHHMPPRGGSAWAAADFPIAHVAEFARTGVLAKVLVKRGASAAYGAGCVDRAHSQLAAAMAAHAARLEAILDGHNRAEWEAAARRAQAAHEDTVDGWRHPKGQFMATFDSRGVLLHGMIGVESVKGLTTIFI